MAPHHSVLAFAAVAATTVHMCNGHGAVTFPRPRNAIDSDVAPWVNGVPHPVPFEPWCPIAWNDWLSGVNGQACFWFSNGCTIGCDVCDGTTRGPIPDRPGWSKKMPACNTTAKATLCDPAKRTVNTDAECGADNDYYYYSPWRAPGSAPVFDSCGMAGGTPAAGGFGAVYTTTPNAKQGDLGSKMLKAAPSGTVWKAGSIVEVGWALQANHGGGYQYRLCPADQPLTEACFQKTPLPFVGQQTFQWGTGANATRFSFNGTYVTEGTTPAGSMWARNPIPRNDTHQTGASFQPACDEVPGCGDTASNSKCKCSGMWGPYNLQIIDQIQLPSDLAPGAYVLGWRWDCEESSQIWSSCSDITINA